MATKFYKCNHCGNVIEKIVDSKVPVFCCGEKHIPVVTFLEDNIIKIEVGSVHHPMLPEHHIAFVYVETEKGGIRINLKDEPVAVVHLGDDKATAVYEYCNLHGLWKVEL